MSESVIDPGENLHIITRRLFPDDLRRHFAGRVQKVDGALCELQGYTFIFNTASNEYRRRPELRTRVFDLGDANFIVNKIPRETNLGRLSYQTVGGRMVITDGAGFLLDVNEFGATR